MKKNTRQDILDTAKRLFNARGYNDVSMQDIAGTLGISKGNLTYYFSKKVEVAQAIITENLKARVIFAPTSLEELGGFFARIQQVVQDNAFYFWHYAQLGQVSQKIHGLQQMTFNENTQMLLTAFGELKKKGLIRAEEYEGEYGRVVDSVLIASVYWIPFCELKGDSVHGGYLEQAWSIVRPLLTKKGRKVLEQL